MIFSKIVVPLRGKTARRQAAFGKKPNHYLVFSLFCTTFAPEKNNT